MIKFCVKLVALDLFESFALLFPEKGHTHGPLDGVFGQMCVKLCLEDFEDDMHVVQILDDFLKTSGLDAGSKKGTKAYKLDEAAKWVDWAETVRLTMFKSNWPRGSSLFPNMPPKTCRGGRS